MVRARSQPGAGREKRKNAKLKGENLELKLHWGELAAAEEISVRKIARDSGLTRGKIRYWQQKYLDPTGFHPLPHGGVRMLKFEPDVHQCIEQYVRQLLEASNVSTLGVLTVRLLSDQ